MAGKISVIMPVYNCERYLQAALDSVLSQEGVEVEVIAVEDCSPDRSREILREAAARDARIRPIYHEKNMGVAAVRNRALQAVTGEFIAFCDSDDLVPPGAYRALTDAIGECDVAVGGFADARFDETTDGDPTRAALTNVPVGKRDAATAFGALFAVCCLWTKLFRASFVFEKALCFDESMHIGEDVVFLANAVTKAPTYAVTPALVYWHCHHETGEYFSLTHVYTLQTYRRHIECREKLLQICREVPGCRDYVYLRFSHDVIHNLFRLPVEEREEGYALFHGFMCGYDYSRVPRLFVSMTGMDYGTFCKADARQYFSHCLALTSRERVAAEFDCGMIGFRWILRYFKGWLRFKWKRNYR